MNLIRNNIIIINYHFLFSIVININDHYPLITIRHIQKNYPLIAIKHLQNTSCYRWYIEIKLYINRSTWEASVHPDLHLQITMMTSMSFLQLLAFIALFAHLVYTKPEMKCPENEVYKIDTPTCHASCQDRNPMCDTKHDACVCKDGFVRLNGKCVPTSKCGCPGKPYMEPYSEKANPDCSWIVLCLPGGITKDISQMPCDSRSTCLQVDGKFKCVCKKGYKLVSGECKAMMDMKCPENEEYKFGTPTCQASCRDRNPMCDTVHNACVCKDGFVRLNGKCVPTSKCGCTGAMYMEPYTEMVYNDCSKISLCLPGGKTKIIYQKPCDSRSTCLQVDGKYKCVCKKGYKLVSGECKAMMDMECPENEVYKFGTPTCHASCQDRNPMCDTVHNACVCKDGFVRLNGKCVPTSKCGCPGKPYMEPYSEKANPDCSWIVLCLPGGRTKNISQKPCDSRSKCKEVDGKFKCVCKKGYKLVSGECKAMMMM